MTALIGHGRFPRRADADLSGDPLNLRLLLLGGLVKTAAAFIKRGEDGGSELRTKDTGIFLVAIFGTTGCHTDIYILQ
jgi:hypothetical protein